MDRISSQVGRVVSLLPFYRIHGGVIAFLFGTLYDYLDRVCLDRVEELDWIANANTLTRVRFETKVNRGKILVHDEKTLIEDSSERTTSKVSETTSELWYDRSLARSDRTHVFTAVVERSK